MACIVVPLDGSPLSEEILPYAEDFARHLHAEVYLIQVVDTEEVIADAMTVLGWAKGDEDLRSASEYLSQLATAWREMDIDARWQVVEGRPAASIVEFARAHQACMIAMCTHGRSGLDRLFFRSVAGEVMREAGIPVLLVRSKKRQSSVLG